MDEKARLKNTIQSLNSDTFEEFVASVWSAMGWSTRVTQSSQDEGVDIVATKSGIYDEKVVIQAKRYSDGNNVGRPEIQQYSALKKQIPETDAVIIVTSSDFTSEAKILSQELNIKTIAGDKLANKCIEYLSDEEIEELLSDTGSYSTNESDLSGESNKTISIDNLSESERDLAKIYKGYYNRYIQDGKNDKKINRRLWFDVNGIEEVTQKRYVVYDQIHLIGLNPEDDILIRKIEKTANKYGWEVLNRKRTVTERVGIKIPKVMKKDSDFSLALDTSRPVETVTPERQGKISSQLTTAVFNKQLSGMKVAEVWGVDDLNSSTTKIE